MLISFSFFLLSTVVGAMSSICPASDVSMSGSTTGCISSTFLHMNSDRLVKVALVYLLPLIGISLLRHQRPFFQVGGEGGPSTCLAACLAVYPRQSSLGLAVRWS